MSLIKRWQFTESKNFEFAQVFNLTNTPASRIRGTSNLATGGQVTATRNQPEAI
jgi:hypothetical protein